MTEITQASGCEPLVVLRELRTAYSEPHPQVFPSMELVGPDFPNLVVRRNVRQLRNRSTGVYQPLMWKRGSGRARHPTAPTCTTLNMKSDNRANSLN